MSGNQFIEPELPQEPEIPVVEETKDTVEDSTDQDVQEAEPTAEKKVQRPVKRSAFWKFLSGEILTRKSFIKQLPMLFLLFFYAIIYIGMSRMVEKNIKEISTLKTAIKGDRNKHIYLKSELMKKSKQTQIERSLDTLGVKSSTSPVIILYNNPNKNKK